MTPRIETLREKKLVGKRMTMSLSENRTADLWKDFMLRRNEIVKNLTSDLISMQIYQPSYFSHFNLANTFEKWAAVEVSDFEKVPASMETFILPGGLHAVFDYRGSSNDAGIFQYIHGTWLPGSAYTLDDRPHFEILGDKYENNNPTSEEEIWIPVKTSK